MGCTTSIDGSEPGTSKKNQRPAQKLLTGANLSEEDNLKIGLVLDYWYDEGGQNNS